MTETAVGMSRKHHYLGADSSALLLNIANMSQELYGVWYRIVATEEISEDGRAATFTD